MTTFAYWVLLVFAGYFAVLIGISVFRARHMDDMSDYVLGGRRMGTFTSALSAASSSSSGWTMLVFPALAFSAGLIHLWTAASIAFGAWLVWTVMGKRLRRYTIATDDSLTLPEFFEKRFLDRTGTLRTLSALITIFFIVFYVSSGLIAGAKLLEEVFEITHEEYHWVGVLITLIAITTYTFIGGFLAVSRTDVFQSLMMLGDFVLLPLMLIVMTDAPFQGLGTTGEGFWNPFTDQSGDVVGIVFVLSTAGWGLGALGSQRVLARLMAVDREENIPRSRNIGVSWVALIFGFGLLLGLVAVPALAERGLLAEVTADPERVYLITSRSFFHPLVAGLLLTAVIAAVMSTADSQLLLASAIATGDVPLMKRLTQRAADARPRLAGTADAARRRGDRGGPVHLPPRLGVQPRLARLGRHGGGVRPGNHPCPVLAALQLLGRAHVHPGGHGGRHLLVAPAPGRRRQCAAPGPLRRVGRDEGGCRRPLEHPAGHPRLPDRDACGGAGHPADPASGPRDGRPV